MITKPFILDITVMEPSINSEKLMEVIQSFFSIAGSTVVSIWTQHVTIPAGGLLGEG